MKKLIALLLFPCMAWGQVYDNIIEDKSLPDDYWHIPVAMGDSIGTAEIRFKAGNGVELHNYKDHLWIMPKADTSFYYRSAHEDEILFLLELYERECYNDSTRAEIWDEEFIATDSIGDAVIGYTQLVGRIKWKHREPTFTGFIKWLKARK